AEEYAVRITQASMAPVTRVVELFRRDTTAGRTATVDANGRVDVGSIGGTAQTARDIGASVLLSSGTGTGQVSLSAGIAAVNVTQFGGAAGTFASGRPEVNTTHAAGTAWNSGAITANTFAAGAITAAKFAANALDAVWSTATRVLTAGTNIVLAKGTGITGFNDLDATGVRGAIGMASANLDTQLSTLSGNDTTINNNVLALQSTANGIKAKTDNLPAAPAAVGDIPTANQNADALLDRASGIEAGMTLRQGFRLWSAALLGKANGLGTGTAIFRDTNDTKDRINASVDQDGNRLAVILDPS
ncbi:hypothetical protein EN780_28815, partial [Mesorhizobium sp. M4B.F.Ca.ET.089.01.1.1]